MEDLTPLIRAQRTTAWREVARRIAHEIKNPLTPIQLSVERILKKLEGGVEDFPKAAEESANAIVREVGTLKDLVDEFSRFARMLAVRIAFGDPNAVVESVLALYDGTRSGLTFVRQLAAALPSTPFDAEQMKR